MWPLAFLPTPSLCRWRRTQADVAARNAVVRAVISAPTHFLEQLLGRAALPLRQLGFLLQNLRQNFNPFAELRRWLNSPRVFELRLWPRMTLRTVARDADSIRTISLTERSCSK